MLTVVLVIVVFVIVAVCVCEQASSVVTAQCTVLPTISTASAVCGSEACTSINVGEVDGLPYADSGAETDCWVFNPPSIPTCVASTCNQVQDLDASVPNEWVYEDRLATCKSGFDAKATGKVIEGGSSSVGLKAHEYQCCEALEQFVVVEAEVTTVVADVDSTWNNLNEYDINYNMAQNCLPPVVVTYEPIGNASLRERCWTLATAAVSLVLVIVAAEF